MGPGQFELMDGNLPTARAWNWVIFNPFREAIAMLPAGSGLRFMTATDNLLCIQHSGPIYSNCQYESTEE